MKKIIYLLSMVVLCGCLNTKYENIEIKEFFDTMSEIECVDSSQNKFNLKFNYSYYNQEKESFDYLIPDSVEKADFYNAYARRLISAFYQAINSDTTITFEKLLSVDLCDTELVKEEVMNYCAQNQIWHGIFNLAKSSYYENDKVEKPNLTIDSLVNISMSYFDIAGYSKEGGFAFHFVCGSNPFEFKYENKTALLICEFCQEALKNPEMSKAYDKIIDEIGNSIKSEYITIDDFQSIKEIYEPKLHELLKEEKALKESLIAYYKKRKDIEPFILEY